LETIEAAQHLLWDAAELLSPVPGLAHEWKVTLNRPSQEGK